jgi:hypothetical protein
MSLTKGKSFSVVRVEKMEPIAGMIEEGCYRYVIECGRGQIVGARFGTLQEVSLHANAFIYKLNGCDNNSGNAFWLRRRKK